MAVDAEWHHSRSTDLSYTPQLSEYGVIGCASTKMLTQNFDRTKIMEQEILTKMKIGPFLKS